MIEITTSESIKLLTAGKMCNDDIIINVDVPSVDPSNTLYDYSVDGLAGFANNSVVAYGRMLVDENKAQETLTLTSNSTLEGKIVYTIRIDFTNISKLIVRAGDLYGYSANKCGFGITSKAGVISNMLTKYTITSSALVDNELDVSSLTGYGYVYFWVQGTSSGGRTFNLYSIKTE